MKLLNSIVVLGTLFANSHGFSGQLGNRNIGQQEAAANAKQALNIIDLPNSVLAKIFESIGKGNLGAIASTNSQMRALAQESISKLTDGVQLRGVQEQKGRWMLLRTALEEDEISQISEIKNIHTLLRSCQKLRSSFINAIVREATKITSNVDLSRDDKQEKRDQLHKHLLDLGLTSTLDLDRVSEKPALNLADLLIPREIWYRIRLQIGIQVEAHVESRVRVQVWDQVDAQVWTQVWDQGGGQVWAQIGGQVLDQVWGQIGGQIEEQIGRQVSDQVIDSICANFNFTEKNLDSELPPVIDHAFLVFQLASFVAMHSPDFEEMQTNLRKIIKEEIKTEKIEEILAGLDIPTSDDQKIDAFLYLMRKSVTTLNSEPSPL